MELIQVLDVRVTTAGENRLWGGWLDAPSAGARLDVHALTIAGWVVSRTGPVVEVLVTYRGQTLRSMVPDIERPDVASVLPHVAQARRCGFHGDVSVLGLLPEFELEVHAVLGDGSPVPIGLVRGRRRMLESDTRLRLQPLLVTALGRSGSTWLMRLLSAHPTVVVHRVVPYETRVGSYWAQVLRVLTAPANHRDSTDPHDFVLDHLWVGHNPFFAPPATDDERLRVWLGRKYPQNLATWCRQQMQHFYTELLPTGERLTAQYFAEKAVPHGLATDMLFEMYPEAREVVLVRDFRDMYASIEAFNAKRGYPAFGRERSCDERAFIRDTGASADALAQYWQERTARTHLVRYEDLVRREAETLSALLLSVGLHSDPSVVAKMMALGSKETSETVAHRTSSTLDSSVGRWRCDLNPSQQALCQSAFGGALRAFGYEE